MFNHLSNELQKVNQASSKLKVASTLQDANGSLITAVEGINKALEQATVTSRNILERLYTNGVMQNRDAPELPYTDIGGTIKIIEYNWLYIKLNTLLPHCRYQTPAYLTDTITRLLDYQSDRAGKLPHYKNAMLIIDEHCNITNRNPFDQDNKGWKAIPNALKGRVIADDNQFNLSLALLSTKSENFSCNIFVIDILDAESFFNLRSNGALYW